MHKYQSVHAIPLVLLLCNGACETNPGSATPVGSSTETKAQLPASASSHSRPPSKKTPKPAGDAELRLVAPLVVGSTLGDFSVRAIHAIEDGLLVVECEKERARVRLSIALREEDGPAPPASAGRYAVFYSLRGAEVEQGEALALALAAILEKHADVPVPPGLGKFVPKPVPI